jgi:guanylate kinase
MTTVFIISAPSGSGKSTLVANLLRCDKKLLFSMSYTTRAPRGQEVEGQNYHYISKEEFERRLRNDEFLEHAVVFGQHYYGTHKSVLEQAVREGKDLVLDIDVQGARQLKDKIEEVAVTIFVLAPSRQILEQRLRARSEDAEAVIQRRLREAAEEIRRYRDYDYVLVNDQVEESTENLVAIVRAERVRRSRMENRIAPILASFEQ